MRTLGMIPHLSHAKGGEAAYADSFTQRQHLCVTKEQEEPTGRCKIELTVSAHHCHWLRWLSELSSANLPKRLLSPGPNLNPTPLGHFTVKTAFPAIHQTSNVSKVFHYKAAATIAAAAAAAAAWICQPLVTCDTHASRHNTIWNCQNQHRVPMFTHTQPSIHLQQ